MQIFQFIAILAVEVQLKGTVSMSASLKIHWVCTFFAYNFIPRQQGVLFSMCVNLCNRSFAIFFLNALYLASGHRI